MPRLSAKAALNAIAPLLAGLLTLAFPTDSDDQPYNITPVVKASIEKVLMTLVEAVVLVFIVMFLFLQNIRTSCARTVRSKPGAIAAVDAGGESADSLAVCDPAALADGARGACSVLSQRS